jgi:glycosyltransferase involved in cell wall biosynthesis
LVTPADADALAAALGGLAADPGLRGRLGRAARARVERDYNLANNTTALVELFRSRSDAASHA